MIAFDTYFGEHHLAQMLLASRFTASADGALMLRTRMDCDTSVAAKTPIEDLDLSVRSQNCLKSAKIYWIEDLEQVIDLMKIPSFGSTSLREIKRKLAERGLRLRISR